MGGLIFILILFALPETSALILKRRAQDKQNKELGVQNSDVSASSERIWTSMARPFKFIAKPIVILATTPYSMAYGFMYFMIASLPLQLTSHYNFLSYQIGLAYLPNGVGNAVGAYISGKLADRAIVDKDNVKSEIENRLTPMWIGIVVLPAGLLMYGWCVQFSIHVAATFVGLFLCKYLSFQSSL
jgi:MFS family permease